MLENGLELDEDEDEEDECRSERGDAERLPNGQRGEIDAGEEIGPGVGGVGLDAGGEVIEGRTEGGVDGVVNVRAVDRWVPETEGMAESLKKKREKQKRQRRGKTDIQREMRQREKKRERRRMKKKSEKKERRSRMIGQKHVEKEKWGEERES